MTDEINEAKLTLLDGHRLVVEGAVSFHNIDALREQGEQLVASVSGDLRVELHKAEPTCTVLAALMISFFRCADFHQISISFHGVSAELQGILEFSGLSQSLAPAAA